MAHPPWTWRPRWPSCRAARCAALTAKTAPEQVHLLRGQQSRCRRGLWVWRPCLQSRTARDWQAPSQPSLERHASLHAEVGRAQPVASSMHGESQHQHSWAGRRCSGCQTYKGQLEFLLSDLSGLGGAFARDLGAAVAGCTTGRPPGWHGCYVKLCPSLAHVRHPWPPQQARVGCAEPAAHAGDSPPDAPLADVAALAGKTSLGVPRVAGTQFIPGRLTGRLGRVQSLRRMRGTYHRTRPWLTWLLFTLLLFLSLLVDVTFNNEPNNLTFTFSCAPPSPCIHVHIAPAALAIVAVHAAAVPLRPGRRDAQQQAQQSDLHLLLCAAPLRRASMCTWRVQRWQSLLFTLLLFLSRGADPRLRAQSTWAGAPGRSPATSSSGLSSSSSSSG